MTRTSCRPKISTCGCRFSTTRRPVTRAIRVRCASSHRNNPDTVPRRRSLRVQRLRNMSRSYDLVINGKTVKANYGETLVDAGLSGWVAIPHDCNSGQCETCRVSVVSGQVDDRGTGDKGTVLACQAKVIGNAAITFDHVPEVAKRSGVVTGMSVLTSD